MRGIGRAQTWLRRATAGVTPRIVILMYHRVFTPARDPLLLCVTPERFAAHMAHLASRYPVLRLRELTDGIPGRGVVVTFDDGYADNLHAALPILEHAGVPATVFVTTGMVEQPREFWWDELERLLVGRTDLPDRLRLSLSGIVRRWDFARESPFAELHQLLRPMRAQAREEVLEQVRHQLGDGGGSRADFRALTWAEVAKLMRSNLVDIGAHTVSHPVLSAFSADDQRREITDSRRQLEANLGLAVTTFAYPYGGREDVNGDTVEAVRQGGIQLACTTLHGPMTPWSERLALPRLTVRDWTVDEFANRIEAAFRA